MSAGDWLAGSGLEMICGHGNSLWLMLVGSRCAGDHNMIYYLAMGTAALLRDCCRTPQ